MAFKMKGPSLTKGTSGHTKALRNVYYEQLNVNRKMDFPTRPDGRAGSSPFQVAEGKVTSDKGDKDVKTRDIKWGPKKEVSKSSSTDEGGTTTTKTDYETKGTSKGKKVERQAKTPEEIAAWKKAPEKNKDKYRDKTHNT